MREIKFRARDGEKMFYPHQVYNIELSINKVGGWCLWDTSVQPHKLLVGEFDEPKLQLMQYTTLKDRNDKEIYEGDIVEQRYHNPLADEEKVDHYKIETMDNTLVKMVHSSGKEQWDRYLYMQYMDVEVIGNIYENPTLLEG